MAKTLSGRNRYTWAEFLRNITPSEYGAVVEISQAGTATGRQARYTLALWQAEDLVDFNEARTVAAITWLVQNTDAWTVERAQELS
jgi:hypothetical protein